MLAGHAMLCHVQNMLECSVIHPEQREKVLLGHCAQVGAPLQSRPLPRLISHVARYKGNCQYCKQHCGRESVSMACPSSPDPSSYSLSDILPSSTILQASPSQRLFAVNLQHKTCFHVFHYRKAKKSGWNSFIS